MTKPYNDLLAIGNQNFIWGNDLLMAEGGSSFSYLNDHLGSPIRLVAENQEETLAYDEFGVPTVEANNGSKLNNPFGFTGYQFDDISGLYFAQARYYEPNISRFVSEDTIGDRLNWYSYCGGNPIRFIDPSGHIFTPPAITIPEEWIEKIAEGTVKTVSAGKKVTTSVKTGMEVVYNDLTDWHFEVRDAVNGVHPTYYEVLNDPNWRLLPQHESSLHDNKVGKPELKYIHKDGREAVFDGDDHSIITDPQYKGTYNYFNLLDWNEIDNKENWWEKVGYAFDVGFSYVFHGIYDVIPWWFGGNVRGKDDAIVCD